MQQKLPPDWSPFFKEFSEDLNSYATSRTSKNDLTNILASIEEVDVKSDKIAEVTKNNIAINPFNVFYALLNMDYLERVKFLSDYASYYSFENKSPRNFAYIPSQYGKCTVVDEDINDIYWDLFNSLINYSNEQTEQNEKNLRKSIIVLLDNGKGSFFKLTTYFYLIDPYTYLPVYAPSIWEYTKGLAKANKISSKLVVHEDKLNFHNAPMDVADYYIELIKEYHKFFKNNDLNITNFIDLFRLSGPKEEDMFKNDSTDEFDTFMKDVFITREEYNKIASLLEYKKNLCLQGPPGVGKTFMAKRLAYAMMGLKDDSKIKFVQFHQSYSYEDFIMGYKPTENGFELQKGVFYEFCKEAEDDPIHKYFFIIDEINRGNLSKIFGELFMLVENDKRGEGLRLLYRKEEEFSIPSNVYIIGMMNTADRSLAMMDYALRRRFAFYTIEPALSNPKFVETIRNTSLEKLVDKVNELNKVISADQLLGPGFQIGHSYFCASEDALKDPHLASNIVEYELVPLVEEYWYDDDKKKKEWIKNLRESIGS